MVTFFVAAVVVSAVVVVRQLTKPNVRIKNAPAVTYVVKAPNSQTKQFNQPLFSIALPIDWQSAHAMQTPEPTYSWRNTTGNAGVRTLEIFVDSTPATFAVNRVLPIESNGASLVLASNVSDNCTGFSNGPTNTQTGQAVAKWAGVNFLCDEANYQRDVVGTSSTQGVNSVTVSGPKTGKHTYFFVYTDNSAEPDYNIFIRALQSFQAI